MLEDDDVILADVAAVLVDELLGHDRTDKTARLVARCDPLKYDRRSASN
jgi:hypothetical protein